MTPALLAVVYWCLKIAGAILLFVVGLWLKLRGGDKRRQLKRPGRPMIAGPVGAEPTFAERDAPLLSRESKEPVAHVDEIESDLHTGDLFLFSGRALHSYLIRIPTWSRMSHAGMIYRDSHSRIMVAEVVERLAIIRDGWRIRFDRGGFRFVPLADYVRNHPGQCYVAKVAAEYDRPDRFNRTTVRMAIDASTSWGYGWRGIAFQVLTKLPLLRELAYLRTWRRIDQSWGPSYSPFCSWAVSIWATTGGQDPTPCLAPQLTTPAEIERSKLWGRKVALVP